MKKLAMLLAICLLATLLPAAAVSEGAANDFVEALPGEAVGETGALGLIAEPEGDAPDEGYTDDPLPENTESSWGEEQQSVPETTWAEQPASDATWSAEQPVPETTWAEQPASDATWSEEQPAPDAAWGEEQSAAEWDPAAEAILTEQLDPDGAAIVPGDEYAVEAALLPAEGEAAEQPATPEEPVSEQAVVLPPHTDPNGPQLAAYDVVLGVGEYFALGGYMPAGREGAVAYASANEAVAAVTAEGVVIAVSYGDVRLTVTAYDGTYAECDVHVRNAPEAVGFNVGTLAIGKGEITDALTVSLASSAGECAGAYSFHSSNSKIVAVNASGAIKGVKRGKAVVSVTTYNGLSASCTVTVKKVPGKLTIAEKNRTLGVGELGQVAVKLPKNTASQITYVSQFPEIVAVDPVTGTMQGVGVGVAMIRASTFNGKNAYMTVTVLPAPQTLSFGASEFVMGVGMSTSGVAAVEAGAAPSIAYSVSNPAVAAVDGGKILALAAGEAEIVATTYNGLSASCRLVVKPAPAYVRMPYATLTLGVGESVRLQPDVGDSAATFKYKSSSKKRAVVSADGVVTGLKTGKATITIQTYNKKKCKLKVVVKKEMTALSIAPASAEMNAGEWLRVTANIAGAVYSSTNPEVAQVDVQTGDVFAVGSGTAEIVASMPDGRWASCAVTVYGAPEWIALDSEWIELALGQARALGVALSPLSRSQLRFTSLDPTVVTVSEDGTLIGIGPGQTTVVVETEVPGIAAQAIVTVQAAPEWMRLEPAEMTLNVQETCQLTPVIPEGMVTAYAYSSSDESVATVSQDGAVLAIGRGVAALTVVTANGLTASMELTVLDPWYPESASLINATVELEAGHTVQLEYVLSPENAVADFEWASSSPEIVSVSGDGLIQGNALGEAVITARSRKNSALTLETTVKVVVEKVDLTLTIPYRTTDVAGIPDNLARIDAIRASAIRQIDALRAGSVITDADAAKRRSMVNNAFADYAFPWMTPSHQAYWKAANSEGGVKDFQPDRVYYGLPYISGSGTNRQYNIAKALSEGRYTDSGLGYYLLNQANLLNGKYCGNDCSGFVDAAIWGNNSGHSSDRTSDIASSSAYKTVTDGDLRTGDLICKSNAHVVMFLYYASDDHSQIMIIENGGIEPGTNTVHCIVMNIDFYKNNGYSIRRLASLG